MSKRNKVGRNPYGNTKRRKAAFAWMAAQGITQPRPLYPMVRLADIGVKVTVGPLSTSKALNLRTARLVS
jgi:hypothetical protein